MPTETRPWDPVDHLDTPEDVAAYLEAALEDGDPELVTAVLCDIARYESRANMAGRSREP